MTIPYCRECKDRNKEKFIRKIREFIKKEELKTLDIGNLQIVAGKNSILDALEAFVNENE